MDDTALQDLAWQLGREWLALGVNLGITRAQIEHIQADHPLHMNHQIMEMLVTWRRGLGRDADPKQLLVGGLDAIGRADLAAKVATNELVDSKNRTDRTDFDLKACRTELVDYYLNILCKVRMHPLIPSLVRDFGSIYSDLQMVYRTHERLSEQSETTESSSPETETNTKATQLSHQNLVSLDGRGSYRVLLTGKTGSGKSTLLIKLTHDWSNLTTLADVGPSNLEAGCSASESFLKPGSPLSKFTLLFTLKLNQMSENPNLVDAIFDQILSRDTKVSKNGLRNYIENHQDEVLFLLDGLDELPPNVLGKTESTDNLKDVFLCRALRRSCIIVTSKHHIANQYSKIFPLFARVETTGFGLRGREEYINKYFKNKQTGAKLISAIRSSVTLSSLSEIPLLLQMICLVWADRSSLPGRLTELYDNAVRILLMHHDGKKEDSLPGRSELPDGLMKRLGRVALEGLLDKEGERLVFPADDFQQGDAAKGCEIGLLVPEDTHKELDVQSTVAFLHEKKMSTSSANSSGERTFQYEDALPSLSLPPLKQTLRKYLESTRPFLTEDEFQKTEKVVRAFEEGIGLQLHHKLQEKARTSKNWLEHWWEELAYMAGRSPLAVQCNINGLAPYNDNLWHPMDGTQCERAAISIWYQMSIFQTLRREEFPVDKSRNGKVFSMNQLRGLYNCSRIPGEVSDKLVRFFKTESEGPCPNHLVVFSNGHIFSMRPFDNSGRLIPAQEIYRQLCHIKKLSKSRGQAVGALTADDRTSFAKAYKHLRSVDPVNGHNLDLIEQAVITVQLDDACPKTPSEFMETTIKGDVYSRWAEKSYNLVCFSNGVITCSCDHAPFDGMVIITVNDVIFQQLVKTSGRWPTKDSTGTSYKPPEELIFTVDEVIKGAMQKAVNTFNTNASNLLVLSSKCVAFGKRWTKLHKLHPDSVFQLALLNAYYSLHGKPVATYETATLRQFYHGRTETVRSCTMESVRWCQAMLDASKSTPERRALFLAALKRHNENMADSMNAQGCDRHLLGLQAIAMEDGLPMPALYTDPAYTKSGGGGNFLLSTSCAGYCHILGAVAPMCKDGYSVFYNISDEHYEPCILTFKSDKETDIKQFFVSLNASLMAIKNLFMDNSKM